MYDFKQATEVYDYRPYVETLLIYGSDASTSHLTNVYWYLCKGKMLPCDPKATVDATTKVS